MCCQATVHPVLILSVLAHLQPPGMLWACLCTYAQVPLCSAYKCSCYKEVQFLTNPTYNVLANAAHCPCNQAADIHATHKSESTPNKLTP